MAILLSDLKHRVLVAFLLSKYLVLECSGLNYSRDILLDEDYTQCPQTVCTTSGYRDLTSTEKGQLWAHEIKRNSRERGNMFPVCHEDQLDFKSKIFQNEENCAPTSSSRFHRVVARYPEPLVSIFPQSIQSFIPTFDFWARTSTMEFPRNLRTSLTGSYNIRNGVLGIMVFQ